MRVKTETRLQKIESAIKRVPEKNYKNPDLIILWLTTLYEKIESQELEFGEI